MAAKSGTICPSPAAGPHPSQPPCTLVMVTPEAALTIALGGAAPHADGRINPHARLIEFVRALARDAARADYTAERDQPVRD